MRNKKDITKSKKRLRPEIKPLESLNSIDLLLRDKLLRMPKLNFTVLKKG